MANTFNFGNGNWAQKTEKVLAYNAENNNYKPLPFDFDRASSATRVNKQGLIETVGTDEPRIDFLNNTKGHLLLEPSRQNTLPYSQDFSQWSATSGGSVVSDQEGIGGSNDAFEFVSDGSANSRIFYTISATGAHSFSVFAKKNTLDFIALYANDDNNGRVWYNLANGTLGNQEGNATGTIEDYGNGWYRCTLKWTSSNLVNVRIYNSNANDVFGGTAGSVFIQYAQLEAGSYATSYIPTQGETNGVTRSADDISLTFPDTSSFNSSVGFSVVSKFDIGSAGTGTSAPFLIFNDDTSNTYIGFGSNSANLRCRLNLSGTAYLNTQGNAPRTQRNSLFVSCDANGWSQGANGSTNHTGTNNASVFDRLASISFTPSEVYGIIKISELLVYNTRLSNSELQALTS